MKLIVATWLLILSLVLSSSFLQYTAAEPNPPKPAPAPPSTSFAPPSFCIPKCKVRCSKSGRAKRCMKYCYLCCRVCFCVPPGTYGNKQVCPCYANMKNDKGKPKCP